MSKTIPILDSTAPKFEITTNSERFPKKIWNKYCLHILKLVNLMRILGLLTN